MKIEGKRWDWPFPVTIIVLGLVYYPGFTTDYAKLDTFAILHDITFGNYDTWKSWISIQGRPLTSILTEFFFEAANGISGLQ